MAIDFDHVHVYCRDLDASLGFYEELLGAERVGAIPNSFGDFNHVVLLGGQFLVLSHYPPGMEPGEPSAVGDGAFEGGYGVAHLGLNVPDLEPLARRLRDAGVELHSAEPRGGAPVRYLYLTAPDGLVVELTQYVVPEKLRPAIGALRLFNAGVHVARRAIGRALVAAAVEG